MWSQPCWTSSGITGIKHVRLGKIVLDIVASFVGLVILCPLFIVIALIILCGDGLPLFFRQERVGQHGLPFRMWKFRTMVKNAKRLGPPLTAGDDARITRIGHWLRKYKLDELPQLVNVLLGHMSLVGPRPEVPRYVALYTHKQRRVLELKPGITDPASIYYRDESRIMADMPDPERFYVESVMPDKIRINLEYASHASVWSDLGVIVTTVMLLLNVTRAKNNEGI